MPSFFTGGIFVAAGDVDGDGFVDIIIGADAGAGPQVNVFSGQDGSLLESFLAFPAGFSGGVRVGTADVNGDGKADIIAGAGPGGLPQVSVFSGANLALLSTFFAFPGMFTGGVSVAGDALGRVIVGAGAGGLPEVSVFNGRTGAVLQSFFTDSVAPSAFLASPTSSLRGVSVGATQVNGRVEILTGPGQGSATTVDVFDGTTFALLDSFFAFDPVFRGGAFVAG
jgi:hypothetical protein